MSYVTDNDNLLDDMLIKVGRELLDDELSSPVFLNLTEINAHLPTFSRREVQFGHVLGKGMAGIVREVKSINLLEEQCCSYDSVQNDSQAESENSKIRDTENLSYPYSSRNGLAALCKRNEESRYAVKTIMVEDACVEQQARARIDLAIEVSYLKVLSHPHIVKIRGTLNTNDLFHPKFFFVMDRLFGTLHDKIGEWDQRMKRKMMDLMHYVPIPFRRGKSCNRNRELLKERLFVAYDIASALSYMHSNKVVHRDIKKQNIGFDIRGNVKVFDFGFAKSLRQDRASCCDYYNITANVGSIPYMAPEVALGRPYNEKCDVFSFGVLLFEIMSLRPPFSLTITENYLKFVAKGRKRPCIKMRWPSMTKVIMKDSWMTASCSRPSMESICNMIKMDLHELETEENIASRTEYIANISEHSSK